MDVAKLIAAATKESLEAYPSAIGVRFSPISISAADLERVPDEVRRLLGPGTYVTASAPGARRRAGERVFIASDQEAAEQATAWRNTVRVAEGERLVYVSVEEHGKASGLRDCLLAVTEAELVDTLLRWMDSSESNLPKGLASALREAGLHESRSLAALTEFARLASAEASRPKVWASVSKNLPALGLARDSGLKGAEDTADRLRANAKLVASALTGEARRRAATGPTAEVEEQLRQALRDAPTGGRAAALAGIDLGEVKTKTLGVKPKKPKPKQPSEPSPPPKKGRSGKVSDTETRAGVKDEGSRGGKRSPSTADPPTGSRQRAAVAEGGGGPAPRANGVSTDVKLHAPPLPEGLTALLEELHRGTGSPARLIVARDARACLVTLPRAAERDVLSSSRIEERLKEPFSRWSKARRAALDQISALAKKPEDVSALLVGALPKVAATETAGAALRRLLDAAVELFRAALDQDHATQVDVLRLDTAEVSERGDVALRLLGPLHVLWLSQALARAELLAGAEGMAETARRLLARAAAAAPAAPQTFPEPGRGELRLARPEAGLIVYERAPDAAVGQPVTDLAEALARRYLEICPHARLGLRIALLGGDVAAFLEGLARAAEAVPELDGIEVLCAQPPRVDRNSAAADAFAAGRIRVDALPAPAERLGEANPHVVVHFRNAPAAPEDEEPSPPEVAAYAPSGAAASTFEFRSHSLRVWTPLGSPGAVAFEALHAATRGRKESGAFVADYGALSLKSVSLPQGCPSLTWHAVVAPSLGRRPTLGLHLIAHEGIDAAQCAVISRELRPLDRALQEGLRQLGVAESRPNILRSLSAKLSERTSTALLSLRRPSASQFLAGVLSLELVRQVGTGALVVPIAPEHLAVLAGEPVAPEQLFMAAVWLVEGALAVRIGFATADPEADLDLSRPTPGGRVGKLAAALAEVWRLAARGAGVEGSTAREFLNWMIWPALAAEDGGPSGVQDAMRAWRLREEAPGPIFLVPSQTAASAVPLRGKRASFSVLTLDPAALTKLLLSA
ncbi:hypothetical protein BE04_37720 [Sorangium cellulosum]|uniref:Uncharacterized protein n=1 Tax=Sorangium cellulosum TaxID=56 RepID=A0A150P0U8_SORCE|nr:hypothetical protein BE04_37720 [Sorangium cellulosum]